MRGLAVGGLGMGIGGNARGILVGGLGPALVGVSKGSRSRAWESEPEAESRV